MKAIRFYVGSLIMCVLALQASAMIIAHAQYVEPPVLETLIIPAAQTATPDPLTVYIDNRSTPEALITSYYNAINRHEYLRSYSYWEAGAEGLAAFPAYEAGYANTVSAGVTIGAVRGGAAAGNIYYDVPVILTSLMDNNSQQTYVGCYRLHLGQPVIQGVPPFRPLAIQSANVQQVANNANTGAMLNTACPSDAGSILPTQTPSVNPLGIDATIYLDDRSDAVQVLRSLFNAVNRHEYVRAYSYWEPTSPELLPFPAFQQGYVNTQSVVINTGQVQGDAGAGQLYYRVPVVLIALTTGGQTQSYVGCYQLHLSQPAIQGTPPFQPLAIVSANVNQVPNNANLTGLMQQACGV